MTRYEGKKSTWLHNAKPDHFRANFGTSALSGLSPRLYTALGEHYSFPLSAPLHALQRLTHHFSSVGVKGAISFLSYQLYKN